MSNIRIRLAQADDEADLLRFIDEHWQKGHVFVAHPRLFHWQHAARDGRKGINFVLARDEDDGRIYAILGYIPLTHFDPTLSGSDVLLAIWKTRTDVAVQGVGLSLLKWLPKATTADFVGAVGLSQMVQPIYRALGYCVGRLEHHVLFSPTVETFRVALGVSAANRPAAANASGNVFTLVAGLLPDSIRPADVEPLCRRFLPRKSWNYLCARYANHPAYVYHFSFVVDDGRPQCLLVWRQIRVNGSAVLRIVDLLGDESALRPCAGDLQELLREREAEYIDIQHHGVSATALEQTGFVNRRATASLVVPGHFEPYEAKNVELDFCYKVFDKDNRLGIRLLRGDSDQDRPNQLQGPGP